MYGTYDIYDISDSNFNGKFVIDMKQVLYLDTFLLDIVAYQGTFVFMKITLNRSI